MEGEADLSTRTPGGVVSQAENIDEEFTSGARLLKLRELLTHINAVESTELEASDDHHLMMMCVRLGCDGVPLEVETLVDRTNTEIISKTTVPSEGEYVGPEDGNMKQMFINIVDSSSWDANENQDQNIHRKKAISSEQGTEETNETTVRSLIDHISNQLPTISRFRN